MSRISDTLVNSIIEKPIFPTSWEKKRRKKILRGLIIKGFVRGVHYIV